jgi:pseudouridine-5'-phosphate glycosidase
MVALETTVVTHGLPYPTNLGLARDMEAAVRENGAVPATIGVLEGKIQVGMSLESLEKLVHSESPVKISSRDFGAAIERRKSGGTTVAGTLVVARSVGIRVLATGGIGGVHRASAFDISADLPALARSPVVVVCSGAKAILDLPATMEYLETVGVPVIGFGTDTLPAFYTRESDLPVSARADSPQVVADIAKAHWGLGLESALLVAVPPPEETAMSRDEVETAIEKALFESQNNGIRGQAVTPYLLARVSELTGKYSLRANLALLLNNAGVAARIASAIFQGGKTHYG